MDKFIANWKLDTSSLHGVEEFCKALSIKGLSAKNFNRDATLHVTFRGDTYEWTHKKKGRPAITEHFKLDQEFEESYFGIKTTAFNRFDTKEKKLYTTTKFKDEKKVESVRYVQGNKLYFESRFKDNVMSGYLEMMSAV